MPPMQRSVASKAPWPAAPKRCSRSSLRPSRRPRLAHREGDPIARILVEAEPPEGIVQDLLHALDILESATERQMQERLSGGGMILTEP